MRCPSKDCGSSNVELLSHYWAGLSPDSPSSAKYRRPAEADRRARLLLVAVAAVGVVMAVMGQVGMGLLLLAAGAVGAVMAHRRIEAVEAARAEWGRSQICLACAHLWVP
jgi:hypothetical protein